MESELNQEIHVDQSALLPNWEDARTHAKAVSVGRPHHQAHNLVCPCCNNVVQRDGLELGTNIKNLSFLGFGMPLYFLFLQYCIILNLLLVLTDGIMMTTEAVQNNSKKCENYNSPNASSTVGKPAAVHHSMFLRDLTHFSGGAHDQQQKLKILCNNAFVFIANVNEQHSTTETIARISSFIIQVLFLIYMKNSLAKTGEYYNQISVDLSDYSVIFKGLPKLKHKKRQKFEKLISTVARKNNRDLKYFEIIVVPQNQKLQELIQKKEQLNQEYLHLRLKNREQALKVLAEYKENYKHLEQEVRKSKVELKEDTMDSENVILVFQTEEQRSFFMDKQNSAIIKTEIQMSFGYQYGQIVEMSKCSDPKEIMWHHLQHFSSRKLRVFYGWFLSFLFLFVIFVVFYLLSEIKARQLIKAARDASHNKPEAQLDEKIAAIIAWATLIGVVIFNKFIMGPVLHYFTHLEHHDDKANDDFSFAFKYALGMFFTTCLMTITVEALMHKNYYSHPFGIVEEESLMFIFSSILVPLIWLIHPYQLAHKFQRWLYEGTEYVTQKEANHLMADYEYSVGKRYAQILEMMWFAFLYVDLIPAGTLAILVGVCAYYWVDKYNLLNRSSAPHNISKSLSLKIVKLLDLTLIWRFSGQLLFDYQLKGRVELISIVLLCLSILFMLLPWRLILNELVGEEFKLNDKKLSEVYEEYFLQDNYVDKNPIYNEMQLKGVQRLSLMKINPIKKKKS